MTRCWTGWLACLVLGLPALLLPSIVLGLLEHASQGRRGAIRISFGLAGGALSWAVMSRSHAGFWRTLHHEISHAGMALLVGGRPSRLEVRGETGSVGYSMTGPLVAVRSFLVTIAPYWVSPFALVVGAVLAVATPGRAAELCLAAVAAGMAIAAPLMEIDPRQQDIRKSGRFAAVACSVWLWAGTTVLILQALSDPKGGRALGASYLQAFHIGVRAISLARAALTLQ